MRCALAAIILLSSPALATTYYVDVNCTSPGNGTRDTCDAGDPNNRMNNLQTCMSNAVAGDTCVVRPGDYFKSGYFPGNREKDPIFYFGNHGTAGNPITVRGSDPANPPRICSADNCSTAVCNFHGLTIGTLASGTAHDYIVLQDLRVIGGTVFNGDNGSVLRNVEVSGGWTYNNSCPAPVGTS